VNDISRAIKSIPTCVLFLDTLPATTETELAERLWQVLGINLDPDTRISIKPDDRGNNHAMIVIDRACAADWIQRLLEERGEKIRCKPAKSRTERHLSGTGSRGREHN